MNKYTPSNYFKSLNILSQKAPLLKTLLRLSPSPLFSFNNELKLRTQTVPYFHNDEFKKVSNLIVNEELKTLFIYGTALGSYYEYLIPWLKKKKEHRLVFFEDKLEILKLLLSSKIGLELIQNPQVDLFYLNSPNFWEQNQKILRSKLNLPFEIISQKSYLNHRRSSFKTFKDKLLTISMDQNAIFAEYLYSSHLFYQNTFYNFPTLHKACLVQHFFNEFKGLPAIICGAGPSMNECVKDLEPLYDKALIFAGGRSLSVLNDFNIEPHFSLGVDPYEMHEHTYSQNNFFELPLIYRARMHHGAVEKAHGEMIYTPKGIGYPLVEWLEENLAIESPIIEEGMNVVNFSLNLAQSFGCNPIILVGCDLAYRENNAYSSSCVLNQTLPQKGSLDSSDYSIHRGAYKKNGKGKTVYTLWKWIEEAKWMGAFAQSHPKTEFINTNLLGLQIPHFKNIPLKEVEVKYFQKTYDFKSMIFQKLMQSPRALQKDAQINSLYLKIKQSLKRTIELLQLIEKKPTEILEEDLKNEIAYQKMLSMLDELFFRVEPEMDLIKRKQKRASFLLGMSQSYNKVLSEYLSQS